MRSRCFALLAILLCTSAAARVIAAASLTPLGFLSNDFPYIEVQGVSGDGSVVVGGSFAYGYGYDAFRWTSDGGMVGLGDLPGGDFFSAAFDVSGDGSVVVGNSYSASGLEAFRWTSGGGMVGLGDLPGREFDSWAFDVSGDGSVVVGYGTSGSGREAFRWTSAGGMVGLGDLPGGGSYSLATSVSADGSVIVGTGNSASGDEAFRWASAGGMVGLGKLPGGSSFSFSRANDISADGSVIVGYSGSGSVTEAFRWTSDAGMVGLGKLPGALRSEATGVSGDGSTVVGVSTDFNDPSIPNYSAFYWTADGGMRALWDVLLSHGVNLAADGWTSLGSADGISADGSTIVGFGVRNGDGEAFVAVIPIVPEPAGDFNHDGTVDAADYVVWRKNNIDGESGYNTWRANFGATSAGAATVAHSSTSVPEPAAGALALLGVSSILLLRRRSLGRPNEVSLSKDEPCD